MLFFQVSASFSSLFLFFYFSSIFLTKSLFSLFKATNIITTIRRSSTKDGSEDDDSEYPWDDCLEKENLFANGDGGGDGLLFLPSRVTPQDPIVLVQQEKCHEEITIVQQASNTAWHNETRDGSEEEGSTIPPFELEDDYEEEKEEEFSLQGENLDMEDGDLLGIPLAPPYTEILSPDDTTYEDKTDKGNGNESLLKGEGFAVSDRKVHEAKIHVKEDESEEILTDSYPGGSTSNSSREWRTSTTLRDSETEDPFSSSSQRSASHWETYTVYRKYDEAMIFLDRISAQKLTETESFRSIQVKPRSISGRLVHKLNTGSKFDDSGRTPYQELEAAYVAQICLTWEALNWNYNKLSQRRAAPEEEQPGCPGHIAQKFQQFQVLLQRFIETEPFEQGRRPEIFTRMRISSPQFLQVPEFQGEDGNQGEQGMESKVPMSEFLTIVEDAITTFMNFLKAERESYFAIFGAFFKKNQVSVDPTLLHLIKKANKKKKKKLTHLRRSRKCFRRRRLKEEEERQLLMGLIDLKVVSRVLKMAEISKEQLHWCEEKMSRVRVSQGKLHRDPSPLLFPAH